MSIVASLRHLSDRRFVAILLLGFSSGLPLLLVGSTLRFWLADRHVDVGTIGLFSLVSLPYALKFLWAPFLDRIRLPFPTGRRKSWGILIQLCLAAALIALAVLGDLAPTPIAAMAVLVAFLSASQDVVIDAFRIELLDPSEYAIGGAIGTLGYRCGMLAAGAGALYIAQLVDWHAAYLAMACLMVAGPTGFAVAPALDIPAPVTANLRDWLYKAFAEPLADFRTRPHWPLICLFIALYKLAPVLALGLTPPFYKDLGFSKAEVAGITKVFGLLATIAGGFAGAGLVRSIGLWRSLWWCGVAQALALYAFAWLAVAGHDLVVLTAAIGAENVTGAMAATAIGTYIAALCDKRFTATQFALLTALAALTGDTLGSVTGYVAQATGWQAFYLFVPFTALPGLAMLRVLRNTVESAH